MPDWGWVVADDGIGDRRVETDDGGWQTGRLATTGQASGGGGQAMTGADGHLRYRMDAHDFFFLILKFTTAFVTIPFFFVLWPYMQLEILVATLFSRIFIFLTVFATRIFSCKFFYFATIFTTKSPGCKLLFKSSTFYNRFCNQKFQLQNFGHRAYYNTVKKYL